NFVSLPATYGGDTAQPTPPPPPYAHHVALAYGPRHHHLANLAQSVPLTPSGRSMSPTSRRFTLLPTLSHRVHYRRTDCNHAWSSEPDDPNSTLRTRMNPNGKRTVHPTTGSIPVERERIRGPSRTRRLALNDCLIWKPQTPLACLSAILYRIQIKDNNSFFPTHLQTISTWLNENDGKIYPINFYTIIWPWASNEVLACLTPLLNPNSTVSDRDLTLYGLPAHVVFISLGCGESKSATSASVACPPSPPSPIPNRA
ncbi:2433_t:CDS:2, partial [Acaulospora colombiana]